MASAVQQRAWQSSVAAVSESAATSPTPVLSSGALAPVSADWKEQQPPVSDKAGATNATTVLSSGLRSRFSALTNAIATTNAPAAVTTNEAPGGVRTQDLEDAFRRARDPQVQLAQQRQVVAKATAAMQEARKALEADRASQAKRHTFLQTRDIYNMARANLLALEKSAPTSAAPPTSTPAAGGEVAPPATPPSPQATPARPSISEPGRDEPFDAVAYLRSREGAAWTQPSELTTKFKWQWPDGRPWTRQDTAAIAKYAWDHLEASLKQQVIESIRARDRKSPFEDQRIYEGINKLITVADEADRIQGTNDLILTLPDGRRVRVEDSKLKEGFQQYFVEVYTALMDVLRPDLYRTILHGQPLSAEVLRQLMDERDKAVAAGAKFETRQALDTFVRSTYARLIASASAGPVTPGAPASSRQQPAAPASTPQNPLQGLSSQGGSAPRISSGAEAPRTPTPADAQAAPSAPAVASEPRVAEMLRQLAVVEGTHAGLTLQPYDRAMLGGLTAHLALALEGMAVSPDDAARADKVFERLTERTKEPPQPPVEGARGAGPGAGTGNSSDVLEGGRGSLTDGTRSPVTTVTNRTRPTEAEAVKLLRQEIERLDQEIAKLKQSLKDFDSKSLRRSQELEAGRENVERRLRELEATKERLRRQGDPDYFPHRAGRANAHLASAHWKAVELGAGREYGQSRYRQMLADALQGARDQRGVLRLSLNFFQSPTSVIGNNDLSLSIDPTRNAGWFVAEPAQIVLGWIRDGHLHPLAGIALLKDLSNLSVAVEEARMAKYGGRVDNPLRRIPILGQLPVIRDLMTHVESTKFRVVLDEHGNPKVDERNYPLKDKFTPNLDPLYHLKEMYKAVRWAFGKAPKAGEESAWFMRFKGAKPFLGKVASAFYMEALQNRPDSGFEHWLRRDGNALTHVRVDRRTGAQTTEVPAENTEFFRGTDQAYLEELGLWMEDGHAIRLPSVYDVMSQFMQQAMALEFGYEMDPVTHQPVRYFSPQDLGWAVYDTVPFEDAQGFRMIDETHREFLPAATRAPVNPFTGRYIEYGLSGAKLDYWLYHPELAGKRVYAWKVAKESVEPVLDEQAAADLRNEVRTVQPSDVILIRREGREIKLPVGATYLAKVQHVGASDRVMLSVHGRPERLAPGAAYLPAGEPVTLVELLDEDGERAPAIQAAIRGPQGTWYIREGEPIPAFRYMTRKEWVDFGYDRYTDVEQDTPVTDDLRYAMKLSSGEIVPAIMEFGPPRKPVSTQTYARVISLDGTVHERDVPPIGTQEWQGLKTPEGERAKVQQATVASLERPTEYRSIGEWLERSPRLKAAVAAGAPPPVKELLARQAEGGRKLLGAVPRLATALESAQEAQLLTRYQRSLDKLAAARNQLDRDVEAMRVEGEKAIFLMRQAKQFEVTRDELGQFMATEAARAKKNLEGAEADQNKVDTDLRRATEARNEAAQFVGAANAAVTKTQQDIVRLDQKITAQQKTIEELEQAGNPDVPRARFFKDALVAERARAVDGLAARQQDVGIAEQWAKDSEINRQFAAHRAAKEAEKTAIVKGQSDRMSNLQQRIEALPELIDPKTGKLRVEDLKEAIDGLAQVKAEVGKARVKNAEDGVRYFELEREIAAHVIEGKSYAQHVVEQIRRGFEAAQLRAKQLREDIEHQLTIARLHLEGAELGKDRYPAWRQALESIDAEKTLQRAQQRVEDLAVLQQRVNQLTAAEWTEETFIELASFVSVDAHRGLDDALWNLDFAKRIERWVADLPDTPENRLTKDGVRAFRERRESELAEAAAYYDEVEPGPFVQMRVLGEQLVEIVRAKSQLRVDPNNPQLALQFDWLTSNPDTARQVAAQQLQMHEAYAKPPVLRGVDGTETPLTREELARRADDMPRLDRLTEAQLKALGITKQPDNTYLIGDQKEPLPGTSHILVQDKKLMGLVRLSPVDQQWMDARDYQQQLAKEIDPATLQEQAKFLKRLVADAEKVRRAFVGSGRNPSKEALRDLREIIEWLRAAREHRGAIKERVAEVERVYEEYRQAAQQVVATSRAIQQEKDEVRRHLHDGIDALVAQHEWSPDEAAQAKRELEGLLVPENSPSDLVIAATNPQAKETLLQTLALVGEQAGPWVDYRTILHSASGAAGTQVNVFDVATLLRQRIDVRVASLQLAKGTPFAQTWVLAIRDEDLRHIAELGWVRRTAVLERGSVGGQFATARENRLWLFDTFGIDRGKLHLGYAGFVDVDPARGMKDLLSVHQANLRFDVSKHVSLFGEAGFASTRFARQTSVIAHDETGTPFARPLDVDLKGLQQLFRSGVEFVNPKNEGQKLQLFFVHETTKDLLGQFDRTGWLPGIGAQTPFRLGQSTGEAAIELTGLQRIEAAWNLETPSGYTLGAEGQYYPADGAFRYQVGVGVPIGDSSQLGVTVSGHEPGLGTSVGVFGKTRSDYGVGVKMSMSQPGAFSIPVDIPLPRYWMKSKGLLYDEAGRLRGIVRDGALPTLAERKSIKEPTLLRPTPSRVEPEVDQRLQWVRWQRGSAGVFKSSTDEAALRDQALASHLFVALGDLTEAERPLQLFQRMLRESRHRATGERAFLLQNAYEPHSASPLEVRDREHRAIENARVGLAALNWMEAAESPRYVELVSGLVEGLLGLRDSATNLLRGAPAGEPSHQTIWTTDQLVASAFFTRAAEFFRSRDAALADRCQTTARQLAEAVTTHLYSRDLGRFIRGATVQADGSLTPDPALSVEAIASSISALGVGGLNALLEDAGAADRLLQMADADVEKAEVVIPTRVAGLAEAHKLLSEFHASHGRTAQAQEHREMADHLLREAARLRRAFAHGMALPAAARRLPDGSFEPAYGVDIGDGTRSPYADATAASTIAPILAELGVVPLQGRQLGVTTVIDQLDDAMRVAKAAEAADQGAKAPQRATVIPGTYQLLNGARSSTLDEAAWNRIVPEVWELARATTSQLSAWRISRDPVGTFTLPDGRRLSPQGMVHVQAGKPVAIVEPPELVVYTQSALESSSTMLQWLGEVVYLDGRSPRELTTEDWNRLETLGSLTLEELTAAGIRTWKLRDGARFFLIKTVDGWKELREERTMIFREGPRVVSIAILGRQGLARATHERELDQASYAVLRIKGQPPIRVEAKTEKEFPQKLGASLMERWPSRDEGSWYVEPRFVQEHQPTGARRLIEGPAAPLEVIKAQEALSPFVVGETSTGRELGVLEFGKPAMEEQREKIQQLERDIERLRRLINSAAPPQQQPSGPAAPPAQPAAPRSTTVAELERQFGGGPLFAGALVGVADPAQPSPTGAAAQPPAQISWPEGEDAFLIREILGYVTDEDIRRDARLNPDTDLKVRRTNPWTGQSVVEVYRTRFLPQADRVPGARRLSQELRDAQGNVQMVTEYDPGKPYVAPIRAVDPTGRELFRYDLKEHGGAKGKADAVEVIARDPDPGPRVVRGRQLAVFMPPSDPSETSWSARLLTLPIDEKEPILIPAKGSVYRFTFTDLPALIKAVRTDDYQHATPIPNASWQAAALDAQRQLQVLRIGDEMKVEIVSRTETDPKNPFKGKVREEDTYVVTLPKQGQAPLRVPVFAKNQVYEFKNEDELVSAIATDFASVNPIPGVVPIRRTFDDDQDGTPDRLLVGTKDSRTTEAQIISLKAGNLQPGTIFHGRVLSTVVESENQVTIGIPGRGAFRLTSTGQWSAPFFPYYLGRVPTHEGLLSEPLKGVARPTLHRADPVASLSFQFTSTEGQARVSAGGQTAWRGVDIGNMTELRFRIQGAKGGERFAVECVSLGRSALWIPPKEFSVGSAPQEIRIPLSALQKAGLDLKHLESVRLHFGQELRLSGGERRGLGNQVGVTLLAGDFRFVRARDGTVVPFELLGAIPRVVGGGSSNFFTMDTFPGAERERVGFTFVKHPGESYEDVLKLAEGQQWEELWSRLRRADNPLETTKDGTVLVRVFEKPLDGLFDQSRQQSAIHLYSPEGALKRLVAFVTEGFTAPRDIPVMQSFTTEGRQRSFRELIVYDDRRDPVFAVNLGADAAVLTPTRLFQSRRFDDGWMIIWAREQRDPAQWPGVVQDEVTVSLRDPVGRLRWQRRGQEGAPQLFNPFGQAQDEPDRELTEALARSRVSETQPPDITWRAPQAAFEAQRASLGSEIAGLLAVPSGDSRMRAPDEAGPAGEALAVTPSRWVRATREPLASRIALVGAAALVVANLVYHAWIKQAWGRRRTARRRQTPIAPEAHDRHQGPSLIQRLPVGPPVRERVASADEVKQTIRRALDELNRGGELSAAEINRVVKDVSLAYELSHQWTPTHRMGSPADNPDNLWVILHETGGYYEPVHPAGSPDAIPERGELQPGYYQYPLKRYVWETVIRAVVAPELSGLQPIIEYFLKRIETSLAAGGAAPILNPIREDALFFRELLRDQLRVKEEGMQEHFRQRGLPGEAGRKAQAGVKLIRTLTSDYVAHQVELDDWIRFHLLNGGNQPGDPLEVPVDPENPLVQQAREQFQQALKQWMALLDQASQAAPGWLPAAAEAIHTAPTAREAMARLKAALSGLPGRVADEAQRALARMALWQAFVDGYIKPSLEQERQARDLPRLPRRWGMSAVLGAVLKLVDPTTFRQVFFTRTPHEDEPGVTAGKVDWMVGLLLGVLSCVFIGSIIVFSLWQWQNFYTALIAGIPPALFLMLMLDMTVRMVKAVRARWIADRDHRYIVSDWQAASRFFREAVFPTNLAEHEKRFRAFQFLIWLRHRFIIERRLSREELQTLFKIDWSAQEGSPDYRLKQDVLGEIRLTFAELTEEERQALVKAIPKSLPPKELGDPWAEESFRTWINKYVRGDRPTHRPASITQVDATNLLVAGTDEPWRVWLRILLQDSDVRTTLEQLRLKHKAAWGNFIKELELAFGADHPTVGWLRDTLGTEQQRWITGAGGTGHEGTSFEAFCSTLPARGDDRHRLIRAVEEFANERVINVHKTIRSARQMFDVNREYYDLLVGRRGNQSLKDYLSEREAWVQSHTRVIVKYELPGRRLLTVIETLIKAHDLLPGAPAEWWQKIDRLLRTDKALLVDVLLGTQAELRGGGLLMDRAQRAGFTVAEATQLFAHVEQLFSQLDEMVRRYEEGEEWSEIMTNSSFGQTLGGLGNEVNPFEQFCNAVEAVAYARPPQHTDEPIRLFFAYDRPEEIRHAKFAQLALGLSHLVPGVVWALDAGMELRRHELRDTILAQQLFHQNPRLGFLNATQYDWNEEFTTNTRFGGVGESIFISVGLRTYRTSTFWRATLYSSDAFLRKELLAGDWAVAEDSAGNELLKSLGGRGEFVEWIEVGQGRAADYHRMDNVRLRYARSSQQLLLSNTTANLVVSDNIPWGEKLDEVGGGLGFFTRKPFVMLAVIAALLTQVTLPTLSLFPGLTLPLWAATGLLVWSGLLFSVVLYLARIPAPWASVPLVLTAGAALVLQFSGVRPDVVAGLAGIGATFFISLGALSAEGLNFNTIVRYTDRWGFRKGFGRFLFKDLWVMLFMYTSFLPDYGVGARESQREGVASFVRAPREALLRRWSFQDLFLRNRPGFLIGTLLLTAAAFGPLFNFYGMTIGSSVLYLVASVAFLLMPWLMNPHRDPLTGVRKAFVGAAGTFLMIWLDLITWGGVTTRYRIQAGIRESLERQALEQRLRRLPVRSIASSATTLALLAGVGVVAPLVAIVYLGIGAAIVSVTGLLLVGALLSWIAALFIKKKAQAKSPAP
ncbi:MAG TPA: hypothetical protein DDX89_00055, partial [Candidatus Omnitrophica bacterium]|nr:hypothetical protein [Candidatus Omnitrophota bacterium]